MEQAVEMGRVSAYHEGRKEMIEKRRRKRRHR
jgi:hypothetical protein